MPLPVVLKDALRAETARIPQSKLTLAANELSQRYRSPDRDKCASFMTSEAHRLAYLAVRMPATFAVVRRVLLEIKQLMPDLQVDSLLDIGAGPGTATWAASAVFPKLTKAALLEKDSDLLEIGRRLMSHASQPVLQSAKWQQADLQQAFDLPKHDLVLISYVVGEISPESLTALIAQSWASSNQLIAVIEPGTPHGFECIRRVRDQLIQQGAFLVAPCPHAGRCPMEKGDWCHFAERLERSALHMSTKDVSVGYEDEKFSYIVAAKSYVNLPEARILRHPQKRSGHISFNLCTEPGLEQRVISRRHGDLYKQARKLEWGDVLPPEGDGTEMCGIE